MTKLANALEGGLAGATTLSLLTNTLRKIDGHNRHTTLFEGKKLKKRFKKAGSKKPLKAVGQYVGLAGDLLGSTAFLGISPLRKKKNALLRGAVLGTAAGLGAVLLRGDDDKSKRHDDPLSEDPQNQLLTQVLEVGLYAIGGMIAAKVIESTGKKKRKKR